VSRTGIWEWLVSEDRLVPSEPFRRLHGWARGEGPTTIAAFLEHVHEEDRARIRASIDHAVAGRSSFEVEYRVGDTRGGVRWLLAAARVLRDADAGAGRLLGIVRDITDRKRAEAERDRLIAVEREAFAIREAFLDIVSHELRTPITTIYGATKLLQARGESLDPDDRRNLIGDLEIETERLHRIVENLLVLSRAERNQLSTLDEPIQLHRLLDRVVAAENARLPGPRIRLEVDGALPVVAGEETYLEQVIQNLLSNAAKYSPPDAPILVSAGVAGDEVIVRILDEGIGLGDGEAARLFDLFYRSPRVSRSTSGAGIGLFVCQRLVSAMRGRIWARTRPGGGSEFGFPLMSIEGLA
jgi:PAS domain S-box-containing protein